MYTLNIYNNICICLNPSASSPKNECQSFHLVSFLVLLYCCCCCGCCCYCCCIFEFDAYEIRTSACSSVCIYFLLSLCKYFISQWVLMCIVLALLCVTLFPSFFRFTVAIHNPYTQHMIRYDTYIHISHWLAVNKIITFFII